MAVLGENSMAIDTFRGDVSVILTIFAPRVQSPPALPTSVKAYLDALNGILWRDDRQVAHLTVHRTAADHPHRRRTSLDEFPLPEIIDALPWVSVDALPARVYTGQYDRTFDLRDDVAKAEGGSSWGARRYDGGAYRGDDPGEWDRDDDSLRDLYRERQDTADGRDMYDPPRAYRA